MNTRVYELYNIIAKANKELSDIRENCDHDQGYKVEMYGDFRMSIPTKLCRVCDAPLPGNIAPGEAMEAELRSFAYTDPKEQKKYEKEVRERYKS